MPSRSVVVAGLIKSSHPVPSVAVTATATLLAVGAGNDAGTCVLVAAAVFAGQLSVGWANDRIDAERDRRVGHRGKPVAAGQVPVRLVEAATVVAVVATIVLSLLLGWRAGLLHVGAVAVAWAYNAWLKSSWLSWLPYAVAFGALPAVATYALPDHPAPTGWLVVAAALLGTAVNFANALQSLAYHPRSDVSGAPDRLGPRTSLIVAVALVLASGVVIAVSPSRAPDALSWVELLITVVGSGAGMAYLWPRAETRAAFYGLLVIAPIQLVTAVVTGHPLH